MKKNKRKVIILGLFLLLCGLAGCTQEENVYVPVTSNTVEALEDGSITGYIVEPFEKDYYDVKELETMVRAEIDEYNEEKPDLTKGQGRVPILVDKVFMTEDGSQKVVVALNFGNPAVYQDYMGKEIFYGTLADAVTEGYDVDKKLAEVKGGKVLTGDKIQKNGEKRILILEEPVMVRTYQKVQYLSAGAKLTEEGFVDCTLNEDLKYIIIK